MFRVEKERAGSYLVTVSEGHNLAGRRFHVTKVARRWYVIRLFGAPTVLGQNKHPSTATMREALVQLENYIKTN